MNRARNMMTVLRVVVMEGGIGALHLAVHLWSSRERSERR